MKILTRLEKSLECWFLIAISFIFFLLRFPSLFEPDWYGDEGIYQTLGIGIKAGRLLYRDIFDNKPPLLYFLYSLVSSDQFLTRFLSLIFGLLAIWVFFYLAKKLFENSKISMFSTAIFAILFGLPLIEGNIANAENFMLFLNILAGFLILKSLSAKAQNIKNRLLLFSGLIVGISFLFKIVALFDFAAFLIFLVFINYPKNLLIIAKKILPFLIGFIVSTSLVSLFFVANSAFSNFITATFFSNIGYVGYGNTLIIPQGLLLFKLILLGIFCLFIFYKRKSLGTAFTFVSIWLGFSLFNAFFSQRPYTHYVLVLLPSFCLMLGFIFMKKNFSKISGIIVIATLIAVLTNFTFYIKTTSYYQNFISFMLKAKSVNAYQRYFDRNTPKDYEIANYINSRIDPKENIFIWGNNAQVYYLTNRLPPGKYAVAYHISNYKDGISNTEKGLANSKPRFIVIMPNVGHYPFSLSGYSQRINIDGVSIYEKFNQ